MLNQRVHLDNHYLLSIFFTSNNKSSYKSNPAHDEKNPNNRCNTSSTPHGHNDIIEDTNSDCDAKYPGCISLGNFHNPPPWDCPNDPGYLPRGNCVLVRLAPCHPMDPEPQPGCIKINILFNSPADDKS